VAVSQGERLVAIEWLTIVFVMTGDALASSQRGPQGGPKLPQPARYFAAMVAYLMLAGLSAFGPNAAKLASRLGGLAALAFLLAPPNPTQAIGPGNRPLIMRFLAWLNAVEVGGFISQPAQAQTQSGIGSNGGTGVASPSGAGSSTALPGAAPGSVISTGTLGLPGGGGPTQIFPAGPPGPYGGQT
jgi:hypothetical protein